ncbi:MAG TPA: Gfo/Idh/MocA family oxidoreductase [Gemmatimonadaceae bacterium]|nr:Gfo/Idh/MocA family oxidoreductase [Gemmatimonadaceae bacterium]
MSDRMRDAEAISRRDLLRSATIAGAGLGLSGLLPDAAANAAESVARQRPAATARETMMGVPFERHATVRIAIVGTGLRGTSVLREFLGVDGVEITALCDVVAEKAEGAKDLVAKAGRQSVVPALYTAGDHDFERLCSRDDIDIVYTATPWEWHVPVCLAALANGKHAATEVPAATTIEDCWKLVDASERARRHCLIMENCCYGANELMVLQMVRAGLFGDIKHGGAAYNHDLREILFETKDEGLWRRAWHHQHNGNLYPTHGLGPVAWYMDIHRGDRFDYLVSMSTAEMGLSNWQEEKLAADDPRRRERFANGDLNSSLLKTVRGRTIRLEHDVTSPRPYSRINSIQGSKGLFEDYPPRIYVEGRGRPHRWTDVDDYRAEFEHPWWREQGERAQSGGHGGMDYIMAWRLVQCMRQGSPPDINVYDAAAWSAPFPLSEESVRNGSAPVRVPDFTRGNWSAD